MDLNTLIQEAYLEDLPLGDITTDNLDKKDILGTVRVIAKSDLVLSGTDVFQRCIHHISPNTSIKWLFDDGDKVLKKQILCTLKGNLVEIIKAERVALNFLGHLSGIATLTNQFQQKIKHTHCYILDTRKTTPLLRDLEKKAVVDGGGKNHRRDLSDFAMIKENHVRIAGSLEQAITQIRSHTKKFLVVEAHSIEDVKICIQHNVDRILLDNMDIPTLSEALSMIPSTIETEASGNMTLERVAQIAETGVNYISVGAITHSVNTADVSMIFDFP